MRNSSIRVVSAAILACVAVACAGAEDDQHAEEAGLVDANVDAEIDAPEDTLVDSSTPETSAETSIDAGAKDVSFDAPVACPGVAVALTGTGAAPRVASISGDTSSAASSSTIANACGGGSAPELVYTFTSDVLGTATLKLAAGYPAVIAARAACDDATSELTCETRSSAGETKLEFLVAKGSSYSIVVDGAGGSSGPFALDLSIAPSSCGNAIAESPEECDDGNMKSGDGCSSTCALETTGKLDQCPGLAYAFSGVASAPRTISFKGDTSTLASSLSSSSCSSTTSSNAIHAITPDVDGSLTLELRASYPNSALYVRRECAFSAQEADCAQTAAALIPTRLTIPVRAGATVWAVVDGIGKGAYLLNATLAAASCGNAVLDGGEDCDDGNTATGDGCNASCKSEPLTAERCASAENLALTAQLDGSYTAARAGNTTGMGDDFPACGTSATSGSSDAVFRVDAPIDGYLTATLDPSFYAALDLRKACKDGSPGTDRLACARGIGTANTIASGAVRAGTSYYVVVDGNGNTGVTAGAFALALKITPAICGNGVIEGTEACDDGGTDSNDGCSATCALEVAGAGVSCANPKAVTTADDGSGTYRANLKFGTTNLNGTGNLGTGCTSQGKEAYLSVTAPIDGVLAVDVKSATFDVALGARSPCSTSGDTNKITCANKTTELGNEHIAFPVESGKTYFVVVDGAKSTDFGKFELDFAIAPQHCGDGVLSGTEKCDDGNTAAGDGCSATCTVETLAGLSSCPGYAINLTGTGSTPRRASRTISTAALPATTTGTCGGSGRDGTIVVTSDVSGALRAQLTAPWSTVLYARTTCADATSELACNADNPSSSVDVVRDITFPVVAGVPIYLFVDGLLGDSGAATLDISVTP